MHAMHACGKFGRNQTFSQYRVIYILIDIGARACMHVCVCKVVRIARVVKSGQSGHSGEIGQK